MKIKKKGVLLMEEIKDNIVHDAFYLISLFNENDENVTQLQVQKIMYFIEAYWMAMHDDEDFLYKCNFNAWAFGPVAIPLYDEFKVYGENPIILNEEQKDIGNGITEEKKKIIRYIYSVFGKLSAMDLVKLTHRRDSPWYEKWEENGNRVVFGARSYIDKAKTKEWFKKVFLNGTK